MPAWVLLGSAHVARGDGARGVEAYRKIPALAPQDPRGPHLLALALRAQGKAAEARRSFEAALALRPGCVEPLGQIAAMALADRQPDAALARVRQQLVLEPRSAPMHALLGRVHLARREMDRAEPAFLDALQLEPRLIEGYVELGRLYGSARKHDEALTKLDADLAVNPKNVVMLMANNLAWIHSEHGGECSREITSRSRTGRWLSPRWPSRWRAGCTSGPWRCCARARCGCRQRGTPVPPGDGGGQDGRQGPRAEGPGRRGGLAGGFQGQGRGEEDAGRAEVAISSPGAGRPLPRPVS
ncbi:MAG: tetratricopeptide repeat protein [Candidatus Rokubacteria bacterium]|nr:tetratricopeptide repeat protein [Candidatus Rokubacteria bacterium]